MFAKTFLAAACSLLAAAAAAPTIAGAATVARDGAGGVVYAAGPGAEDLLVELTADGLRLTDAGAAVELPAGCERRGDDVACSATALRVELGDGDDRLVVTSVEPGIPLRVDGGAGSDGLQGGGGDDALAGGAGDDRLEGLAGADALDGNDGADIVEGGAGPDRVLGGAGDDELTGDGANPPAADVVDGGPGRDAFADYGRMSGDEGPIALTLAGGADDGFPGEGDDVRGVETLTVTSPGRVVGTGGDEALYGVASPADAFVLDGGGGDDELRASGGADRLAGGPGDDTLIGGFGSDRLAGGPGRDRVFGDTAPGFCDVLDCTLPHGADRIDVRDGARDVVTCGPSRDTVLADPRDRVAGDCEVVRRGGAGAPRARGAARLPGVGRFTQRELEVEVRGSYELSWQYVSTPEPRPRCSSWEEGGGTQTMRVRTERPTPYSLMKLGRTPPLLAPTELQRNTGTVVRGAHWVEHPDPCGYCGGELGECTGEGAPPPERPAMDCGTRRLAAPQASVGLFTHGQGGGEDDLVVPLHGDAVMVALDGGFRFPRCAPDMPGQPGLGRFATPPDVPIAGDAYRRVLRLRRGAEITLRASISHGFGVSPGGHVTIDEACDDRDAPGMRGCATAEVEVTLRRTA